jgi:hypothetical protein
VTRREIAGLLEKVRHFCVLNPQGAQGAELQDEQQKIETARIKVEGVMGEDTMVELLEILELYCELLLARFGLLDNTRCVSRDEPLATRQRLVASM